MTSPPAVLTAEMAAKIRTMLLHLCGPQAELTRALEAIASGAVVCRVADGWRSIETAPQDGQQVHLFCIAENGHKFQTVGYFKAEFQAINYDEKDDIIIYEGAWTDDSVEDWGSQTVLRLYPSHWQPLPPSPEPSHG